MDLTPERNPETTPPTPVAAERLADLLRFGALMLRAGATAFRVRALMTRIARSLGFDALSVQFGLGNITASGRRGSEVTTLVRAVGPHCVNARRILVQNGFKAKNISGGMLSRAMRAIAESK